MKLIAIYPCRFLILSILLIGFAKPSIAQQADSSTFAEVRKQMQAFVDSNDLAGAVTVVGTKERILDLEAVGSQNLEKQIPMAKDSIFRIASMTKPITAIGIMILVDEGKLKVEDAVEKYLPEFRGQMLVAERGKESITLKKPSRPITVQDLLTHTSGLPMPQGLSDLYAKRRHTLAEGVMAFSQSPLEFEPGSKWSYCNSGIDTLGRIIEVVSEQPYEEFLQKRIFGPLSMKDTSFYPSESQLERTAVIYDKKDGKLTLPSSALIGSAKGAKYPIPAGGLFSTGSDIARIAMMMLNGGTLDKVQILSPKSVAAMIANHTGELPAAFTPGMGFGFGWAVVRKPTGVTEMLSQGTFGHGGAFGTQYWIDPKQDLFVILMIQRAGLQNGDASPMRKALQTAAVSAIKK